ncbi:MULTISPECIES: peptide-methionine (S)-S-oxide reductase MsrA [Vibrio]|nr:peptide-methionine (S)-S-oxide reductase MsrA [Vibrio furnissii]EEX39386.1 peptide methionine sulfoxide reductase MsrA [Vibrio furnissii CIP 102972]MCG6269523.1 peptide-methionine (S)-S-oxide reductase MsrA [Vibrio furnissii]QDC91392.1 peptide-methionine (S)-S-oxide reductase MsrA [Vibrio furnissii]QTG89381.1 peptide-methionine (S)-S-oxide reductase MsrA [Vibrio furnissii]QTG96728.1 peptide-methionine (S)-S-oxide reductase MsrA [Vibrio furnissii]
MVDKQVMVTAETALPGRATPLSVDDTHFVNQTRLSAPPAAGQEEILIGMGCFWGAERLFWQLDGVVSTSVGYAGGYTPNPTYEEVCTGRTGHTEVVRVIYNPQTLPLKALLHAFWERHDPTQGMRQGNDLGTQYRSAIYTYSDEQHAIATQSQADYQALLEAHQRDHITTEILPAGPYYFAETYHQQYLAKNPQGYCGLGGTGVCFPPSLA